MKAADLRELAIDWLARRHPDALIVTELSVGDWGKALIDVAAVTPTEIVGVEIKGEGDSTTRLGLQCALYSKAVRRMFLLPAPSMEARCFEGKNKATEAWGQLSVQSGQVVVRTNYGWARDGKVLCEAPAQMLQALWKDELRYLASANRVSSHRSLRIDQLVDSIVELVPLREIRTGVCERLRARDWTFRSGQVGPTADPRPNRAIWAKDRFGGD